ncbi:hypothetical protein BB560_006245 [Smittium megazygosporum]|uniref:Uncharacterized protein n=1 Tax=Smittium megazygosporum TaxID=133381 RepID=A0A2T9YCP6_9FUNG|nr:hypothetical protein BB560_006245 [Smittium megazygosporum]
MDAQKEKEYQIMIDGLTLQIEELKAIYSKLAAESRPSAVWQESTLDQASGDKESAADLKEQISKLKIQLSHLSAAYDRQALLIKKLQQGKN